MNLAPTVNKSLKGLLLFCFLFIVKDVSCQLQNACKHNQFRCSDGSKCLTTEKLCNGLKDCPRGEDEKGMWERHKSLKRTYNLLVTSLNGYNLTRIPGSSQWDCSKVTLSTSCNYLTEYKCRYGGCIPRAKLCDGNPDCWGANDEATDVCGGKKPSPSGQAKPSPTRAPSQPRPPQTTSQAPRTRPPPRPPAVQQRPQPPPPEVSGSGCPSLGGDELIGFAISCVDEYNRKIDCTQATSPVGSKATYRCKQYYNPPQTGGIQTERTCQNNGQWSKKRSSFTCSLGCGDGGSENVALITGGIQSKKGKWPWHVALYQEDPPNSGKYEFFCGGSLINTKVVLTAAHCVTKKSTSNPRDPREIRVVLGKYYRSYKKRDGYEQDRNVREINVNDGYNHYNLDNDLAIIWLDKPAIVGDFVRPVCLPTSNDNDVYATRNFGQLVGWGRTSNGQFRDDLQEAKIPIVVPQTCKEAHPTFGTLVRGTTFCAGYLNGTSACDGDSGGGLMFPDNDGQKVWRVQGIVSAGIAKSTGGCQERYYSVFTKVGQFLQWIHGKLDKDRK